MSEQFEVYQLMPELLGGGAVLHSAKAVCRGEHYL